MKNSRPISAAALMLAGVVLILQAWSRIAFHVWNLPYFVDEAVNTEAAYRFFTEGNYVSAALPHPFDPRISTGIASTWAAGLGWITGASILSARLFSVAWSAVLALFATAIAFRSRGFRPAVCVFGAALIWWALQKIPYYYGFIYNLGELNAASLVLLGWALSRRRPELGAFVLGMAVWWGKFIFLPVAAGILLVEVKPFTRDLLRRGFIFLAPLFLWLLLLYLRFGHSEVFAWIDHFLGFLHKGNSGADAVPRSLNLFARLSDPSLEWTHYEWPQKAKIIGLILAAFFVANYEGFFRMRSFSATWSARLVASLVVLYSGWYFFWHPFMYIRHLQPVLYLSFAYLAAYAFLAAKALMKDRIPAVFKSEPSEYAEIATVSTLLLLAVLLTAHSISEWRVLRVQAVKDGVYSARCRNDLQSALCSADRN